MDKRVRRGILELLVQWHVYIQAFDSCVLAASEKHIDKTSSNSFYVTLFSNASREIYVNNTPADFTVKLSRHVDLRNSPNWKVGFCKVPCSSPLPESLNTIHVTPCAEHAITYCILASPQYVCDSTLPCMRKILTTSCWHYEFRNVQCLPVDQRQLNSIRIEFLTLEELDVPFENSMNPTKVVIHFRKNCQW